MLSGHAMFSAQCSRFPVDCTELAADRAAANGVLMECYAVRWLGSRLCVCTVQACGLPAAHDCLPLMTEDLPFQWKKFGMEGVALLGGEVDCRWVSWRPPRYCVCEPQPHGVGVILELREHSSVHTVTAVLGLS